MRADEKQTPNRLKKRPWLELFDQAVGILISSALAALCILIADRIWRPAWDFSWFDHYRGALLLYLTLGTVLGLGWLSASALGAVLARLSPTRARKRHWVQIAAIATCIGGLTWPVAEETFSGAKVRTTWLGSMGPPLMVVLFVVVVFVVMLHVWRAQSRARRGRAASAIRLAAVLSVLAASLFWLDMTFYRGLYPALHSLLEYLAFGLFFASFQLLGFLGARTSRGLLWSARGLGATLLTIGLTMVFSESARTWTDAQLAHAWVDKYYVGRVLERVQNIELGLSGGGSLEMARMDQLARRFDLKSRTLHAKWNQTSRPQHQFERVRNVVFFYVDTLRADVADNPVLMPHLARFRSESIDLRQAYAPGSDTLRSLPVITSGNYFLHQTHPGDLLRLARKNRVESTLVVARSAHEFLQKLLPSFQFDHTRVVADYERGEDVWGYGAHLSTAHGVVDAGIEVLRNTGDSMPFFLWLFHFDQHAWREIDESFIRKKRVELGVKRVGRLNVRYRVLARTIDQEFGRFLVALEESGRAQETAVVFLSDHGEGLGQGGFWVHSIFLWESLVHVPVVMRIPGVKARAIESPTSLVDLAPTFAPVFGLSGEVTYHGENLLDSIQQRRYPILLRGGSFNSVDRIGIVDGETSRKLVVRLEAAFPELHAYETDTRDKFNLAREEKKTVQSLMRILARSPVFPRTSDDFADLGRAKTEL